MIYGLELPAETFWESASRTRWGGYLTRAERDGSPSSSAGAGCRRHAASSSIQKMCAFRSRTRRFDC
jgi:hypothetical protein